MKNINNPPPHPHSKLTRLSGHFLGPLNGQLAPHQHRFPNRTEAKTLSLAPSNFRKLIVKNTSSKNLLGRRKWNRGDNPFSRFNPSTRTLDLSAGFASFPEGDWGGGGTLSSMQRRSQSRDGRPGLMAGWAGTTLLCEHRRYWLNE